MKAVVEVSTVATSSVVVGQLLPDRTGANFDLAVHGGLINTPCTLLLDFFTVVESATAVTNSDSCQCLTLSQQLQVLGNGAIFGLLNRLKEVQDSLRGHYNAWSKERHDLEAIEVSLCTALSALETADVIG